jgi:chemotaxis protein histidine kinase CheA
MDGSIDVETERGVGTLFVVRLPREESSPESSA